MLLLSHLCCIAAYRLCVSQLTSRVRAAREDPQEAAAAFLLLCTLQPCDALKALPATRGRMTSVFKIDLIFQA